MGIVESIMRTFSSSNKTDDKEFELIGNCFGFYSISGGIGASTFINELGHLTSERGIYTVIFDCDPLSMFYVEKNIESFKAATKGDKNEMKGSIGSRIVNSTSPIRDCTFQIADKLDVLSFGNDPYMEGFNLQTSVIENIIGELKEQYDLVLMDIPNQPWIESVPIAMKMASTLYMCGGCDGESLMKAGKAMDLYKTINLSTRFSSYMILRAPYDISIAKPVKERLGLDVICEVPQVPQIPKANLQSSKILNQLKGKEAVRYEKCLSILLSNIVNGIEGKEVSKDA